MSDNITALKKIDEPVHADGADDTQSVGLGTTMFFQIGREDKFELQTILDRDGTLEDWNAVLDKMRRAGERQKAITGIQSLQANMREQVRQLEEVKEESARAEETYQADLAKRQQKIAEIDGKLSEFVVTDKSAFEADGRRGEYKPGHSASQKIAGFEREIAHLQEEQKQADIERENGIKSAMAHGLSCKKQADFCTSEIARLSAELQG